LIGALAATGKMPIKKESLLGALRELVSAKYIEINLKAFKLGYDYVKRLIVGLKRL
jgi:indolepyruvate ferredoxin oxidoreductase beta subunit